MIAALGLARRGLGRVWPNPAVGCVLVRGGRIVGRGWTQPGGRPHAEAEALTRAGDGARGATAYVTLEPCSHHEQTPPCADALIAAGIVRAVVAMEDPDARVSGRGVAQLRQSAVAVAVGLCAEEAEELNLGFLIHRRHRRPAVTLKVAATLDGRIATAGGESRWITGEPARERAHLMRAQHDAVAVGLHTALKDDPDLTCRLPGMESRSPVRVVFDSRLGLSPTSRLARSAREVPLWVIHGERADPDRIARLAAQGAIPIAVATDAGRPGIALALAALAQRGITRLLVEGGASLAAAFLRVKLVDRLCWFRAASLLGGDGVSAIAALEAKFLAESIRLRLLDRTHTGDDMLETYRVLP
ncbi:MAG: bifunctional diaminohydroxyphosphoribosylaminopyrimidine deaminase/5-amino-6-(5-phosphoribosylamino)uracil reductase RibD [Alphaproteobacteria bacterium]|nr:bifunctional diaminohydroxyphosphoribosylaminopyrimidine deaminase/5-amino-6-(5-phosphoribosylamino)uracil reductase RibD [Alphaproteobacteria bacterium]